MSEERRAAHVKWHFHKKEGGITEHEEGDGDASQHGGRLHVVGQQIQYIENTQRGKTDTFVGSVLVFFSA